MPDVHGAPLRTGVRLNDPRGCIAPTLVIYGSRNKS